MKIYKLILGDMVDGPYVDGDAFASIEEKIRLLCQERIEIPYQEFREEGWVELNTNFENMYLVEWDRDIWLVRNAVSDDPISELEEVARSNPKSVIDLSKRTWRTVLKESERS